MTALAFIALAAWAAVLVLPWQPHRIRERLESDGTAGRLDDVTVLIPARNEAAVIERTLAALARQGAGFDVIVVPAVAMPSCRAARPVICLKVEPGAYCSVIA